MSLYREREPDMADPGTENTAVAFGGCSANSLVVIPPHIMEFAIRSLGAFFEPISHTERSVSALDFMDPSKSIKRAQILSRYTDLTSKKLLEIGSGFGTNLAVWIKHLNVDAHGVEPDSVGFESVFSKSRELLLANDIEPSRISNATGESLPFEDESFDIVYSANALEHTNDPAKVLSEAIRVLKPGGLLHIEIPNFLSYFEGHYMVIMPPILWKPMLAAWVRFAFHRDPGFARTLQTQINPLWCRRTIRRLNCTYSLKLLSLGDELFLERLAQPFQFEMKQVSRKLTPLISTIQRINWFNWIGRLIVALQGHYPIYLTVRRGPRL